MTALAIGRARSSCHASTERLALRRPSRVIRPNAKVRFGLPALKNWTVMLIGLSTGLRFSSINLARSAA